MAQFQDEKSSDPMKITHGEREESKQQQAWPTPSAPAFLTKPTQGTDDQHLDKQEHEVTTPHKKSMLQKVKDRAKTFIQKHGHGHGDDHREEEEQHQSEEEAEEDHNHSEQEEKEDKEGKKKEKVEDLNPNFDTTSSDAGSAVSPGSEASSTRNLSNNSQAARDRELTNTGIQDPNVLATSFEPRAATDRPPYSPVKTGREQQELPTAPADTGSAVSPGLEASSTRNLSNDSEAASDREVTNTGIQWTPRDPNTVSGSFEPRAASDRPPSPVETARGQQELPTAPDQSSAAITPILQSTEGAGNTARSSEDVQSNGYSNKYMAHQVDDIGGTNTAVSTTDVPASINPVQSEFSQELPSLVSHNRGEEAPENELYGKDEPEKIDDSEPFARVPRDPEGMMKPAITEEPAKETAPIQQAAEDRWFDADNVVAGTPTVKDQNPSPRYLGSKEFGTTEPISDELEYANQDKVGDTEIKGHAGVSDESQDLKVEEASSEERNENAGRSAAYPVEGSKDTTALMDLGAGTGLHANEKEKERKDEEAAGLDESYMEKNNAMTSASTEENASVASKLGNDENQSVEEATYEPDRMQAEEDNDRNSEKAKGYGDKINEKDSTEKKEIPSKLEYGEHQEPEQEEYGEYQEPEQEEGERRTERPSADDEKGAHEESGTETVISSNQAAEEKAEQQTEDDDDVEVAKSDGPPGKSYAGKMYDTASSATSSLYSRFGFGAAKTAKDEQIQPAGIKE